MEQKRAEGECKVPTTDNRSTELTLVWATILHSGIEAQTWSGKSESLSGAEGGASLAKGMCWFMLLTPPVQEASSHRSLAKWFIMMLMAVLIRHLLLQFIIVMGRY